MWTKETDLTIDFSNWENIKYLSENKWLCNLIVSTVPYINIYLTIHLSDELGRTVRDIEILRFRSPRDPCDALLQDWGATTENATVSVLVEKLRHMGRPDVVQRIEDYIDGNGWTMNFATNCIISFNYMINWFKLKGRCLYGHFWIVFAMADNC